MKSHSFDTWKLWLPLMLLCLLMGCSGGNDIAMPEADGIPKGPGVFTKGDDGAVIFDSRTGGMINPVMKKMPEKPGVLSEIPPEFEGFEDYKQWQEWKKGAEGTGEYKDFKDWQQWKRYQQWKKNQ